MGYVCPGWKETIVGDFRVGAEMGFKSGTLSQLTRIPCGGVLVIASPFVTGDGGLGLVLSPVGGTNGRCSVFRSVIPSPPVRGVDLNIGGVLRCGPSTVITINNKSTVSSSGSVHRFTLHMSRCTRMKLVTVPAADNAKSRMASFTIMSSPTRREGCPLMS